MKASVRLVGLILLLAEESVPRGARAAGFPAGRAGLEGGCRRFRPRRGLPGRGVMWWGPEPREPKWRSDRCRVRRRQVGAVAAEMVYGHRRNRFGFPAASFGGGVGDTICPLEVVSSTRESDSLAPDPVLVEAVQGQVPQPGGHPARGRGPGSAPSSGARAGGRAARPSRVGGEGGRPVIARERADADVGYPAAKKPLKPGAPCGDEAACNLRCGRRA